MLMLMRVLGPDYVVWDKACTIRFKRPARETLFADFHIDDDMLTLMRAEVERSGEGTFTLPVALQSAAGTVYAEFDKVPRYDAAPPPPNSTRLNKFFTSMPSETIFAPRRQSQKANL